MLNLTNLDPKLLWKAVQGHCDSDELREFIKAPWSQAYENGSEMDTLAMEGFEPLLPIEQKGMYAPVFGKFANVSPHRDTHDDEYYILYVVSGTARLHVGSRNTESMELTPGMCVLFNCDATHWADGDSNHPVHVVIGGVSRAVGRAILYAKEPLLVFETLMREAGGLPSSDEIFAEVDRQRESGELTQFILNQSGYAKGCLVSL